VTVISEKNVIGARVRFPACAYASDGGGGGGGGGGCDRTTGET